MMPLLIQGDARRIPLKDESVDMILTSVPFKDEDVEGDYWEFYDLIFKEMYRVSRKCLAIINTPTRINELAIRYPPKRWIIWGKGIIAPAWRFNPILIYQKNGYKVNKYIWSDTIGIAPIKGSNKIHKYQDPTELYKVLIKMFKDCQLIFDPFGGSGTCAVACMELKRDFIGLEIIPEYNELAKKRLSGTQIRMIV